MQAKNNRVRVATRALFLAAATLSLSPVYAQSAKQEFQRIKNLVDRIPLPAPSGSALVGTLDAATGAFTGHTDTKENYFDPGGKGGGKHLVNVDVPATVQIGETQTTINLQGKPMQNLTLKP